MDFFKKMVIITILISFLGLQFPRTGLAEPNQSHARTAESTGITRHEPEFLAPPEMAIPVETLAPEKTVNKRKMNKWLWVGLGTVVTGVILLWPKDGPDPDKGDITIKWNE